MRAHSAAVDPILPVVDGLSENEVVEPTSPVDGSAARARALRVVSSDTSDDAWLQDICVAPRLAPRRELQLNSSDESYADALCRPATHVPRQCAGAPAQNNSRDLLELMASSSTAARCPALAATRYLQLDGGAPVPAVQPTLPHRSGKCAAGGWQLAYGASRREAANARG